MRKSKRAAVLLVLGDHPDGIYALDLGDRVRLTGGLYPVLMRLEDEGLVTSWWAAADPRRRVYGLTKSEGP